MTRIQNSPARSMTRSLTSRLEGRFATEQRQLNRGVRAGTITSAEAQHLQSKLDDLHARFSQDAFESSGSQSKPSSYRDELKKLKQETKAAAKNDELDLHKRSTNIDERIAKGLEDGTLTESEASALKQKSEALKAEQATAVTPEAQKALAQKFQALSKEVRKERHDGEFDAAKRKSSFESRIQAGLADGSLNEKEAARLRERSSKLQDSDARGFNRMSRDIFQERHDNNVSSETMTSSLQARIGALERAGTITAEQATSLRSSLEAATAPDAQSSGARLNALRERLGAYV